MVISYHNCIYIPKSEIFDTHIVQNMELLQELVHYRSLNIVKNCKEDRNIQKSGSVPS